MGLKIYNMAYIGFGGMASHHFNQSKELERINVKGIFDINPERAEFAKSEGLKAYSSRQEIYDDDEIDLVLIAVPNHLHKQFAIEALRAGKHVLCEKPVTITSDDLIEIMAVAKETGKIFAIDQNRRVNKDFIAMKRAVEAGLLGDVYRIESRVEGSRGVPAGWRTDPAQGGGMMLDWGVHLIDQLMYMYDSKVVEVNCKMWSINYPDVDDNFHLTLGFENGLTAYIEVATNNFISHPRWYVLGKDGTLQIDGWEACGKVVRCKTREDNWGAEIKKNKVGPSKTMAPRSEGSVEVIDITAPEDVVDNLNPVYWQLIDAMDGTAPLKITPEQALRVVKVMEAAFESKGDTIHTNI